VAADKQHSGSWCT